MSPVLIVPENKIRTTNIEKALRVEFLVSANDAEDGSLTAQCTSNSGDKFAVGDNSITCTVTDSAGNTVKESFTITVVYTPSDLPPTIIIPNTITLSTDVNAPLPVEFSVTATDAEDDTITPVCSMESGSEFPIDETTVTCTVEDSFGHIVEESFIVAISYEPSDLPPTIIIPNTITLSTDVNAPLPVEFLVTATDAEDDTITPVCSMESGSEFPIDETTVTCTVTDSGGNTVEESFIVNINYASPKPKISSGGNPTAVVLSPKNNTTYEGTLSVSTNGSVTPVELTEILSDDIENISESEAIWNSPHGVIYTMKKLTPDDSGNFKFDGDGVILVSANENAFTATVSVEGKQSISQPEVEYNLQDDSFALTAIIAIIIAAIVSGVILGLPKRKYFRCKTCNHGVWTLNEKDSDGKKIMETHEEHEIEYLNKKQYDDYRKNSKPKYGYA